MALDSAGPFPSPVLEPAFDDALRAMEERRTQIVEQFHFGQQWLMQLQLCLEERISELRATNTRAMLAEWQTAAGRLAANGNVLFLDEIPRLLEEFESNYSQTFLAIRDEAIEYSTSL